MGKDEFKAFAKSHPELISWVKNKNGTWQDLYDVYDIYGEDESAWEKYTKTEVAEKTTFGDLSSMVKNIDMDAVQKHLNTAQKALNFVSELTTKGTGDAVASVAKGPVTPRPLNKFFED